MMLAAVSLRVTAIFTRTCHRQVALTRRRYQRRRLPAGPAPQHRPRPAASVRCRRRPPGPARRLGSATGAGG